MIVWIVIAHIPFQTTDIKSVVGDRWAFRREADCQTYVRIRQEQHPSGATYTCDPFNVTSSYFYSGKKK